jgi:hypothetical protein
VEDLPRIRGGRYGGRCARDAGRPRKGLGIEEASRVHEPGMHAARTVLVSGAVVSLLAADAFLGTWRERVENGPGSAHHNKEQGEQQGCRTHGHSLPEVGLALCRARACFDAAGTLRRYSFLAPFRQANARHRHAAGPGGVSGRRVGGGRASLHRRSSRWRSLARTRRARSRNRVSRARPRRGDAAARSPRHRQRRGSPPWEDAHADGRDGERYPRAGGRWTQRPRLIVHGRTDTRPASPPRDRLRPQDLIRPLA